jgi:hypothetical protein
MRLMLPIKNNLGMDVEGLRYTISPFGLNAAPTVVWSPEPVSASVDDILASSSKRRGPAPTEREEAKQWLREALRVERSATDVISEAKANGFSQRTIRRAFNELGGTVRKDGMEGGWRWALQEGNQDSSPQRQITWPSSAQPGHLREKKLQTDPGFSSPKPLPPEDGQVSCEGGQVSPEDAQVSRRPASVPDDTPWEEC